MRRSALETYAQQARASFNARFWNAATGYLFDVVDGEEGDDPACRPNRMLPSASAIRCWTAPMGRRARGRRA